MARMSYLSAIERYHENQLLIHNLLESILATIRDATLKQRPTEHFAKQYPFLELQYCLDENGIQQGDNICFKKAYLTRLNKQGDHQDLSDRPYFQAAKNRGQISFTSPYISIATNHLCITVMQSIELENKTPGYIVLDVCLTELIEFIMGDRTRARMTPYFKTGYGVIVCCLFCLVGYLLATVFYDLFNLLLVQDSVTPLEPFSIIIFITLALAIFDLGKTILEEEILMHKDIFRHSSTRRTITRFVSTILIAVSIEALLTMFKAALGQSEYLISAVLMMLAVVGLLIALAVYVYLGAKAEEVLTRVQQLKK